MSDPPVSLLRTMHLSFTETEAQNHFCRTSDHNFNHCMPIRQVSQTCSISVIQTFRIRVCVSVCVCVCFKSRSPSQSWPIHNPFHVALLPLLLTPFSYTHLFSNWSSSRSSKEKVKPFHHIHSSSCTQA